MNTDGTGIDIELVDGTVFPLIFTEQMLKKTYDTINDGTIGVDNARKLGMQLPSYYLDSANINYDLTIDSVLKTTKLKEALDITAKTTNQNTKVIDKFGNIDIMSYDYDNKEYLMIKFDDMVGNTQMLITDGAMKYALLPLQEDIETLNTDTSNNNTTIHNIIKGDYITTVNTEENNNHIKLQKTEQGVVIDDSAINLLVNQLKDVSDDGEVHFQMLGNEVGDLTTLTDNIVNGKYIEIENGTGINIKKVHTKGVVIGANVANKSQRGTVQIGNGLNVDENGVVSVIQGAGGDYIPKSDINTIYVSTTGDTIANGADGTVIKPYNNIANAMADISEIKTIIKFMDGQYYVADNIAMIDNLYKFLAGEVNIRMNNGQNLAIDSEGAYIELGSFTGNILINADCTLIIRGELQGNIVVNAGIQPYIRINRYNDTTYPLTLTSANVAGGSVIGRYQFNMIAL